MADDSAPEVPPTGEVVKPKRAAATVLDMVRSLGVMVIVIALTLIFVPGLLHPSKSQRVQSFDYSDDVTGFKQVTGLVALVPDGLPAQWYANSGSLLYAGRHAHLHIGWVSPTNDYAALEESNNTAQPFIEAVLGSSGVHVTSYVRIAGQTWARSVSAKGEKSLVFTTPDGITVVITGSASPSQQAQLAASLAADS